VLPFDCYVWGANVGVDGKLQSVGEFTSYRALDIPSAAKTSSGLFCSCGTAIGMYNGSGNGHIYIAPIKDGNTLPGRVIVKRNQTPAQITQFIEDNIDDNGGQYFATITSNNRTSGIFGKASGTSDWQKISMSDDTNTYKQFGVRLKTANDHIAFLRFPAGSNNYNRLKNGEIPLMLRWGFDHTHS
jgi:hypothetical protein